MDDLLAMINSTNLKTLKDIIDNNKIDFKNLDSTNITSLINYSDDKKLKLLLPKLDLDKIEYEDMAYTIEYCSLETLEFILSNFDLKKLDPYGLVSLLKKISTEKLKNILPNLDLSKLDSYSIISIIMSFDIDALELILPKLDLGSLRHDVIGYLIRWSGQEKLELLLPHFIDLSQLDPFDIVSLINRVSMKMLKDIMPKLDISKITSDGVISVINNNLKKFEYIMPSIDFSQLNSDTLAFVINNLFINHSHPPTLSKITFFEDKTLIGFNNARGEWSRNVAKSLGDLTSKVIIVPLNYNLTNNDNYLKLFDGFINPGAADSFHRSGETHIDYIKTNPLRPHELPYQNIINFAKTHNKPYMGICNGAQHLILNEGGYVSKVDTRTPHIILESGSIVHFLAMDKHEQSIALQHHLFPEIDFDIHIAHSYAGVNGKLGNVQLGGLSTTGVVEAVARNFYQVGFQFHPENRYLVDKRNLNLLEHVFKVFSASKTTDLECMDKYLSSQLEESLLEAKCAAESNTCPVIDFPRDVFQEAFIVCAIEYKT